MSDPAEELQQLEQLAKLASKGGTEADPEIRMPIAGMVYLRFLDEDGTSWMRYRFIGTQQLSLTLGDMQQIAHAYMHDKDDEDDAPGT